jgi:hypothetical protein
MTLPSNAQRILTSPLLIIPTVVIAVSIAFIANLWRKNR